VKFNLLDVNISGCGKEFWQWLTSIYSCSRGTWVICEGDLMRLLVSPIIIRTWSFDRRLDGLLTVDRAGSIIIITNDRVSVSGSFHVVDRDAPPITP
jgi:hypothetical protein